MDNCICCCGSINPWFKFYFPAFQSHDQARIHIGFHSFMENGHIFHNKKMYKKIYKNVYKKTSNNQRLRSAGDNDRRSKRFRFSAVLCVSFTRQKVKPRVNRLRVIEGSHVRDQIALCTFHTLLVEDTYHCDRGPNRLQAATYSLLTTWRLGLRAPLVARN